MINKTYEIEKMKLTPETGFNLVGIDYFADSGNQLYLIEHFEMYQDALNAKKETEVYRSVHNLHSLLEEKNLMIYD